MFDIGFWELAIIAIIALLVVGPERLPEFARTAGFWFGKIRRFVSGVKTDIEQELRADELRQMIKPPEELSEMRDILEDTQSSVNDAAADIADGASATESSTGSAGGREHTAKVLEPTPPNDQQANER